MTLMMIILGGMKSIPVKAEELLNIQENIWESLELENLDKELSEYQKSSGLTFSETVKKLISGELPWSAETWKVVWKDTLFEELKNQKNTAVSLLLLIIGATLFSGFAGIFDGSQVVEVCFYVIYLLLFAVLLKVFYEMSTLAEEALKKIMTFMELLLPSYLLASLLSSRSLSGTAFYELTMGIMTLAQYLICYLILPVVNFYVLLTMLNQLTGEEKLSKMAGLLKGGVDWAMKTLMTTVLGVQGIQNLILPVVDNLKNSVLLKTGGSIPVIGGIFNNVTEAVLGAATLIRNGVGTAGLIVLICLCLVPVGKLFAAGVLYKVVAAAAEPVADKRLAECLDGLGQGIFLLLKILVFTGALFFLNMAMALAAK